MRAVRNGCCRDARWRIPLAAALVCGASVLLTRSLRVEYHVHTPEGSAMLVTGASSGIGLHAALALHTQGFTVYAGVRTEHDAAKVLKAAGSSSRMRPLVLDVTEAEQVKAAVTTITSSPELLVGVINNAGTTYKRPLETADLTRVRQLLEINVMGVLEVTQAMLPALRKAGGRIVNVGSVQGIVAMPMQGPYCATKYALEALSDTLRMELAPMGISVSMVNPGYVNTNLRHKGSPSEELTATEQELYGERFALLRRKDASHLDFAPPCCAMTDKVILHALMDAFPRTRYYPSTASVKAGSLFPAWLAAVVIRTFSIHPSLDRLKDAILLKL